LGQVVVYVHVHDLKRGHVSHADPAIAVQVRIGASVKVIPMMVVVVMRHVGLERRRANDLRSVYICKGSAEDEGRKEQDKEYRGE